MSARNSTSPEVSKVAGASTLRDQAQSTARTVFVSFVAVLTAVAALGLLANGGKKYVRLLPGDGYSSRWAEIGNLGEGTVVSCPLEDGGSGVCKAASSGLNPLMTSLAGATVLPFLGLVVSACWQLCGGAAESGGGEACASWVYRIRFYLCIIAFRTLVLYMALNALEQRFQGPETTDCWYVRLRRRGLCQERFDFADHAVLMLGQILPIQLIETYAVVTEHSNRWARGVALCATVGVSAMALACLYHTVAYYHTRTESAAAFALSAVVVYVPLWRYLTRGDCWRLAANKAVYQGGRDGVADGRTE